MTTIFQTFPLLRQLAPKFSRQFFSCQSCRYGAVRTSLSGSRAPYASITKHSFYLKRFRSKTRSSSSSSVTNTSSVLEAVPSPVVFSSLKETGRSKVQDTHYFPEVSDKVVAYWLLGSAASVFGLVVFGGLTRLTESG